MTLGELIKDGARRFGRAGLWFGHGTDNAWDEAAWLAAHTLGMPLPLAHSALDDPVDEDSRQRIDELYARRIKERRPAAYLVNEAWFCGMPFYVDERVLVPRSPVAELIESRFEPWIDSDSIRRVLDIGTGSGCIAIACAHALPRALVIASDISESALQVAKINVDRHRLQERITLVKSDLFRALQNQDPFDIIISNPPYVPTAEISGLPAEYRAEPVIGLEAGEHGLDVVIPLLLEASSHLAQTGILIAEVGNARPALEQRFPHLPFIWLDFEHGGEGVFLLHAADLKAIA